jgi:hypothetical protein
MARKPNYQFERMERQRAKDAKKAMRLEAKRKKAEGGDVESEGIALTEGNVESDGDSGDSPAAPADGPREDDTPER